MRSRIFSNLLFFNFKPDVTGHSRQRTLVLLLLITLISLFALISRNPAQSLRFLLVEIPKRLSSLTIPESVDGLSFTDITLEAGTGGPNPPDTGGHGVMWVDVDGSNRPDLYITMNWQQNMPELFFHNKGSDLFVEEGALRGIDDFDGGSHGACFADLNNNGHYDLFNGTTRGAYGAPAYNALYQNNGHGFFTEVTASSGLPTDRNWPTRAVLCFDMTGNGYLDLFAVTNYQGSADPPDERNEVYLNQGNMLFTVVNSGALFTAPAGQGAIDTDYNGNGRVDVIAANRTGPVNILRNDGGGNFTLIDPISIGITRPAGDGISSTDVNNNGRLDLLLTGDNYGHLYLNNGDGTFTHHQSFSGTDGYMGGFADLNNNGFVDLVFAGDNKVYLNDGTGWFVPGPAVPVTGINDPRAIAFADIDNDGDMDFAIGAKQSRNWLIRNNFNGGNWLKVRLISPQGQAGAFGAKTYIYPVGEAGGALLGMRESRSNSGYLAQDDPVLHFGLGEATAVDVVVHYLDGTVVTRSSVSASQTITIDGSEAAPPMPSDFIYLPLLTLTPNVTGVNEHCAGYSRKR
jgi:enediyne biosynthesis protein E4